MKLDAYDSVIFSKLKIENNMAEKLETRSELFYVDKIDNADNAKLGYSVVQNTGALILTAQYPENYMFQKIQINSRWKNTFSTKIRIMDRMELII